MGVDVITGLEGIKVVFNDIIDTEQEVVGWGATDRAAQLLPKFTKEYIKRREERGISARQLYVEGSGKLETKMSRWKKIPRGYSLPATTLIYGDRVAIMMWFSKPVMAILIKNRELAQAYKNHFEFLWRTRVFTFDEILRTDVLKNLLKELFGGKYVIVDRQDHYVMRRFKESGSRIVRVVLLPPKVKTASDFTGIKEFSIVSPHPEYEEATVEIKGGIVPGLKGLDRVKGAIKFCYYTKQDVKVGQKRYYEEAFKSTHEPRFKVVRSNGWGFYHNLVNKSNEWICLVLEAKLHPAKTPDFKRLAAKFAPSERKVANQLLDKIELKGDRIFKEEMKLVERALRLDPESLTPILIEALNVKNRGNHEPCTVFALLLKLGRMHPEDTLRHISKALEGKSAPVYYLRELQRKISKRT